MFETIKEKYPQMTEVAYDVLYRSGQMYRGNMLIAKKEVFDSYAAWLFDILFEVEKRIQPEVLQRDAYQQRVYGFLSERMMRIFIKAHPELRVKEVPLLFFEDNPQKWHHYCLKRIKRKILTVLCLGLKKW